MPRTKLDQRNQRHIRLTALITGHIKAQHRTLNDLRRITGIKDSRTINKYMEHPEKAPLELLLKIGRGMNIPIEDVRRSIDY